MRQKIGYIWELQATGKSPVETDTRRLESFAVRERIIETDKPTREKVDTDRKWLNYNIVIIL